MASLGDILSFEKFNLKEMWNKIKKDPERLLLGAVDPISSKLWSGVTGKDYAPAVNILGGPTKDTFQAAEAAGINTKPANAAHQVAQTIAGAYGAAGLGNVGGKLLGTAGAGAGSGTSASPGGFDWRGLAQRIGPNLLQAGAGLGGPQQAMSETPPPPALVAPPNAATGNPDLVAQIKMLMAQRGLGPAPAQTQGEARTSVGSTLTGGY